MRRSNMRPGSLRRGRGEIKVCNIWIQKSSLCVGKSAYSRSLREDLMTTDISAQRLAYLHIRDAIVGGYLPPGAKIRPEAIAEFLNISRMPVRDAIYQLDAEGFIQLVANRGAFVRAYSGEEIIDLSEMRAL